MTEETGSTDLWVLIAAGAVGSIVTVLVAIGVRVSRVGSEIRAHDRALRVEDGHLETWVADETLRLRREFVTIRNKLAARNLFHSGTHGRQIVSAKERALHAYRDQERTSLSRAAEIMAGETWLHDAWRSIRYRKLARGLTAPDRVRPALDAWAAPFVLRGFPTVEVDDPRRRSIESTLDALEREPLS